MTERARSSVRRGGLIGEAVDGVSRRPLRSLLTALGTVLGVGAFVAVLGLTSTANAQVSGAFTARDATQVSIEYAESAQQGTFPAGAERAVADILGVKSAGITVDTGFEARLLDRIDSGAEGARFNVYGVDATYWRTVEPELVEGRVFDEALEQRQVAVIGQRVADQFGIQDLRQQPLVFIDDQPFLVVGIVRTAGRDEVTATSITIPLAYARAHVADARERMIVVTDVGAAASTARQAPAAVEPFRPDSVVATYTPRSKAIEGEVSSDLRLLFLSLAGVCLFVGAVGIANVTLISVMERISEIGLRRSLGALPRHVLVQFLLEAGLLGLLGGLAGGVVGELVVVVVSYVQSWTPTMAPWLILCGAPVGMAVGILSGLHPAARAARIEPVEAFRR